LYVGIGSVILLVLTLFFQTNLATRAKVKTMAEVNQQGAQIMQIINQTIVNAEAINSPSAGVSASSLSLDVVGASDDPTVFNQTTTNIYITEGVGSPLALNSSLVEVSNLSFTNMSKTDTPGNVKVQFTLTFVNNSGRFEYDFSKTFYSSVSLR